MSPYQSEELENIRRAAQRGKAYGEEGFDNPNVFIDIMVHIIDLVERIKRANVNTPVNS